MRLTPRCSSTPSMCSTPSLSLHETAPLPKIASVPSGASSVTCAMTQFTILCTEWREHIKPPRRNALHFHISNFCALFCSGYPLFLCFTTYLGTFLRNKFGGLVENCLSLQCFKEGGTRSGVRPKRLKVGVNVLAPVSRLIAPLLIQRYGEGGFLKRAIHRATLYLFTFVDWSQKSQNIKYVPFTPQIGYLY